MRVIGYARVSREEQAVNGVSLESQRAKVVAYCDLHELEIVDVIEGRGESAKSLKRPGLQKVLAMLADCDGLVVTKLDRLSRSVKDWNVLIDRYFGEKAGKQLFSVSDSIDTRTAAGRLVLNVLMSVAQWEREAISERTRDALRHKKSKGERVGTVPYGWSLGTNGVQLIPSPIEQAALATIKTMGTEGHSLRTIAKELTNRGVPTRKGNRWNHNTVAQILKRA